MNSSAADVDTHGVNIAVVNQSTVVTTAQAHAIATALSVQGIDLASAWDRRRPSIRYYAPLAAVPAGWCVIAILDDADQADALGYHDVTPDGRPYARVFAKTILGSKGTVLAGANSVSACASHEMCEMFGDPAAAWWGVYDGAGNQIALELCDPVQNDSYDIGVGGKPVSVSHFVLPAYFNPFDKVGPYDSGGLLKKPAPALRRGGYAIVQKATGERGLFGRIPARLRTMKASLVSRTSRRLG